MRTSQNRFVRWTFDPISMARRSGGHSGLVAAILTLLAAGAIGASMTGLSWNNPGGGPAAVPGNWTPSQVPTSADDLTFNLNNTYTVIYGAGAPASRTHTYKRGTVTLNVTAPHTIGNGATVGEFIGDVATATLATGTLTSNGAVIVGNASGSSGTLNVSDGLANLILATAAGDLTIGSNGAATMNVTTGGLVQVADRFIAGNNSTSSATVTVSGSDIFQFPLPRSTLDVDGTSLAAAVGAGGDVTMDVSSGALADFAGGLNVAQGSASTSTLTIGGPGPGDVLDAETRVGGDLNIGRNTTVASAGGVGTVNVNTDGLLVVVGALNVSGDPDGGTGTLHLSDGGAIMTTSFAVGTGGTLDLDGGTLDVTNGTFAYTNPSIDLVLGGIDSPAVTLTNTGATLQANASATALTVGGGAGANSASLTFSEGSTLDVTAGDILLGAASDTGVLEFLGSGSDLTMPTTETLFVGQSGFAQLVAAGGATITGGDVFIGQNVGSDGLFSTDGLGTVVDFQRVFIGGSNVAAGGAGVLDVGASSQFNLDAVGTNLKVWPSGRLDVSGELNSAGSVQALGEVNLFSTGLIAAAALTLESGSRLSAADPHDGATVSASIQANPGSVIDAGTGSLTIGNLASVNGFVNDGILNCGSAEVVIHDADAADVNNVTLAGGKLIVPNGMANLSSSTISGFGTIDADIFTMGTITATGAGLTFYGNVPSVGQGISGTEIRFTGGSFTGSGTINAAVLANETSLIQPTPGLPLTIGDPAKTNGVQLEGSLIALSNPITFLDLDEARLRGDVAMTDANITAANGIHLEGLGSIAGRGAIHSVFVGDAFTTITATGALAIGDSLVSEGFKTDGVITVGAGRVIVRSDDFARLGRKTTLAGGALITEGFGDLQLEAGDTLSGFGAVVADIHVSGGLIEATGLLTIGRTDREIGFAANGGELRVGSHPVELQRPEPSTLRIPALTSIDGGSLTANVDIDITSLEGGTAVLRGTGQVTAPSLRNLAGGSVQPGDPIGTMNLSGDYLQPVGTYVVQIGDTGLVAGEGEGARSDDADDAATARRGSIMWDQLNVSGSAALSGTLRIESLSSLVVASGDSFPILTCAARSGSFASIVFEDQDLDDMFDVVFTPTSVVLVASATTGVDLPPGGDPDDGIPGDDVSDGALPLAFGLRVIGRNPFSASDGSTFEYDVPRGGSSVSISVFDVSGRRLVNLIEGVRPAGRYVARWDGAELNALPSGTYCLRMAANGFGATKRLVLVR